MKKFMITLLWVAMGMTLFAQFPGGFSYQAVVRNTAGEIIANKTVKFRITILQDSESGTAAYVETHSAPTGAFGLANLKVGMGTKVSGNFDPSAWGLKKHYMKVELDPNNGNTFSLLGTTQLLAVPYAFHAKTVENDNVNDADSDPLNEIQVINLSGSVLSLSRGGGSVTLPSSGSGGDNWGTQAAVSDNSLTGNGTTASPLGVASNAITSARIADGAVATADLANGAVTAAKLNSMGATTGQYLQYNGTTWTPITLQAGTGLTLPYSDNTGTGGAAFKVSNTQTAGASWSYGLMGEAQSTSGSMGVYGSATATSGPGYGVQGETKSSEGRGVFGLATSSTGNTFGVRGHASSTSGTGVFGWALASSGSTYGVWGQSESSSGIGVYGWAKANSGGTYGLYGEANSISGRAIYGHATSSTGVTYGIRGLVNSAEGFSGYFEGGKFYVSGNVGIGTNLPGLHRLRVTSSASGSSGTTGYFENTHGAGIALHAIVNSTDGAFLATQQGAGYSLRCDGYDPNWFVAMIVKGRKVGINTDNPGDYNLAVNGSAAKTGGGSWSNLSDGRLKTINGNYEKGLSEIIALRPVRFNYTENNPRQLDHKTEQIGFIAQEVRDIFPEAVGLGSDGYYDFNMHPLNVALINAMKELKAENDRLKADHAAIVARLELLEKAVATVAQRHD